MNKASRIIRSGGLIALLDFAGMLVRSCIIRKQHHYGTDFRVGYTTQWLNGEAATIGAHFRAGKRCRIEMVVEHNNETYMPQLSVGRNVSMNDDVHIGCAQHISIGNDVLMASKVFISDHNHGDYSGDNQHGPDISPSDRPLVCAPVVIGDRVWLGEMVSVLPGVTIGEGSIIGSNSVVSRDIPPMTIAVGSPARPVKYFDSATGTWKRIEPPSRHKE